MPSAPILNSVNDSGMTFEDKIETDKDKSQKKRKITIILTQGRTGRDGTGRDFVGRHFQSE